MATVSDKFRSDYLSKEQLHDALIALPAVLEALLGECEIIASYGWAANIHGDLMYKPMREHTARMKFLIEDSIDQRIIVPRESDSHFEVPQDRLDVTFCHECDIHLRGHDDELLRQFMSTSPFSKIQWCQPQANPLSQ